MTFSDQDLARLLRNSDPTSEIEETRLAVLSGKIAQQVAQTPQRHDRGFLMGGKKAVGFSWPHMALCLGCLGLGLVAGASLENHQTTLENGQSSAQFVDIAPLAYQWGGWVQKGE